MTGRQPAAFTRLGLCSLPRLPGALTHDAQVSSRRYLQGSRIVSAASAGLRTRLACIAWRAAVPLPARFGYWSRPLRIDVCSVFARTPRYGPVERGTHVTSPRGVAVQLRMSWHSCDSSFQKSILKLRTLNPRVALSTCCTMFARIIEYVHHVRKHHRHYQGITMHDMLLGGSSLGLCLAGIAAIVTALSSLLLSVAFILLICRADRGDLPAIAHDLSDCFSRKPSAQRSADGGRARSSVLTTRQDE
jgi:hypothetical protein